MTDVVIFGGTTASRDLAEFCSRTWTSALVVTEVDQGLPDLRGVTYQTVRFDDSSLTGLLTDQKPCLIVDANDRHGTTSQNLADLCTKLGLPYHRVDPSGHNPTMIPDSTSVTTEDAEQLIVRAVLGV